jgi:hypothetical protein
VRLWQLWIGQSAVSLGVFSAQARYTLKASSSAQAYYTPESALISDVDLMKNGKPCSDLPDYGRMEVRGPVPRSTRSLGCGILSKNLGLIWVWYAGPKNSLEDQETGCQYSCNPISYTSALPCHGTLGQFRTQLGSGGTEGNSPERRSNICGGVVQLVRTPACHAGGRGLESRRSRHSPNIFRCQNVSPRMSSVPPRFE